MLKHKFFAKKSELNGLKFPSKLEKNVYQKLLNLQSEGKILFILRQIPFDLPGPTKHSVDFQVFTPSQVLFIEAKGRDLPAGKKARKQIESLYPVKIHLVSNPLEIYNLI